MQNAAERSTIRNPAATNLRSAGRRAPIQAARRGAPSSHPLRALLTLSPRGGWAGVRGRFPGEHASDRRTIACTLRKPRGRAPPVIGVPAGSRGRINPQKIFSSLFLDALAPALPYC